MEVLRTTEADASAGLTGASTTIPEEMPFHAFSDGEVQTVQSFSATVEGTAVISNLGHHVEPAVGDIGSPHLPHHCSQCLPSNRKESLVLSTELMTELPQPILESDQGEATRGVGYVIWYKRCNTEPGVDNLTPLLAPPGMLLLQVWSCLLTRT